MGLVGDMFERFLSRQSMFINRLSPKEKEKLAEAENKFAELRVTGPEGGIFYFKFQGQRLSLLEGPPNVSNEKLDKFLLDGDYFNYQSGDEVLFDVIDGSLSPRAVISRHYMKTNTDKIIYDTEELASAFEKFLEDIRRVMKGGS